MTLPQARTSSRLRYLCTLRLLFAVVGAVVGYLT